MMSYSKNRINEIDDKCKSKGIDIETAYVVDLYWFIVPDDHRTHIRNNIFPDCVIIEHGFVFVCNEETATCFGLMYSEYIIKTMKYSKWHKRQLMQLEYLHLGV